MNPVCIAPRAVLPELQPVRMFPLVFGRGVVPLRAFRAGQRNDHTHGTHLLAAEIGVTAKGCIPTKLYHKADDLSIQSVGSVNAPRAGRKGDVRQSAVRLSIMHRMDAVINRPRQAKKSFPKNPGEKCRKSRKKAGSRVFPQKEKAPPRGRGGRTRRQKRGKIAFPRRIFRRKGGWKSIPLHCFTFSFVKQGGNCGLVSKESITKQGEVARSRVFRASWTSDGNRDGARLKS